MVVLCNFPFISNDFGLKAVSYKTVLAAETRHLCVKFVYFFRCFNIASDCFMLLLFRKIHILETDLYQGKSCT